MTSKETLQIMYQEGRRDALALQERSSGLTGTELNAEADKIPSFREAVKMTNMLNRPVGFVCRSSAGRVVRLLQPYDSSIFPQEPEELPAQFGFVWSQDPAKARPFVALSTSPYNTGDCCSEEGQVFRSAMDGNVWAPSAYPAGWVAV